MVITKIEAKSLVDMKRLDKMNPEIKIGTRIFLHREPTCLWSSSSFKEYRKLFLEHTVVGQTHARWVLKDCESNFGEFKLEKNFFGDENFLTKTVFFSEEEILENWKLISGPEGKKKI